MTRTTCITTGCTNSPIGQGLCALHGGVAALGLESSTQGNYPSTGKGNQTEPGELYNGASAGPQPAPEAAPFTASASQPEPAEPEPQKRRCKALNRHGQPCQSRSVDESGLCASHGGRSRVGTVQQGREAAQASVRARSARKEARAAAREAAQMSLADRAAAFIAKPEVQEIVERRWLETLRDGSDSDARQLLRDLLDRVHGRPTEHVDVSADITAEERAWIDQLRQITSLRELSDDELEARLETHEGGSDDA